MRIGLWVAFLIAAIAAFGELVATLKDYNLRFLALPSTWTMLLVASGGIILGFSRANAPLAGLSTFDAILIAGIVLLAVLSTLSNISKTNLIFGVVLTLVQLVFSGLLILVAAMVWQSRNSVKGDGSNPS
jgi:hypothetical protein